MNNVIKIKDWIRNNYHFVLIGVILLFVVFKFLFIEPDSEQMNMEDRSIHRETIETSIENKDKQELAKSSPEEKANKNVIVDVKGAVNFPNTYNMKTSDRVDDVLKKAQIKGNADITKINLSEKLKDQMYIYVPSQGEHVSSTMLNQPTENKIEVNINTGDKAEIEKLPDIGPNKAEAIVQYRETKGEFKTIEDLKKVKGFGEKTVESLKEYIVLD
ncbi:helix-hairpin-helix domain-containing protein [Mammaliicoccus fleurettii]|uniref:Helix-hairpin-helix domain-containing protein n=1 Tax=Mammaliicoccus fleurettii TaxID=150056 RepID=A0ABS5MMK8_9STAP|nr:helix-hairpin-helix domain-containing protein [Mammaliicoccus fleurettii]MBL0846260.1 helix-hairpin-helix domain-containing protein [Mammaliicoccus fleurettii]MBS3671139.1 helix-hairpin-helix domain-containing protein [Mammaliicoccus fleurettii]MBS3696487.1 helix-hairpin-helix domain-containing protein [Mammaliicoccus fleurettii]